MGEVLGCGLNGSHLSKSLSSFMPFVLDFCTFEERISWLLKIKGKGTTSVCCLVCTPHPCYDPHSWLNLNWKALGLKACKLLRGSGSESM